ncbi:MAG TPA: response regulator [Xanthobacteraceae bacterium]|jgi:CheY-like chemotaxis protein
MAERIRVAKRARVLLVEDEPLISDLATDALEEQGFAITAVSNANEALHRLMAGAPIDLLFTDVNLADGMDGTVLARRARELRPDLPVIYTSGRSIIDRSIAVEGAMFVSKPYDLFNVGRLIEHLMIGKRTRAFA